VAVAQLAQRQAGLEREREQLEGQWLALYEAQSA
jgi:hypothetical protein